jgi:hypothetical protein
MRTKILYLFTCLFICSTTATYASHATDAKAKAALNVIRLAYICPTSNSAAFVEAGQYLTDPATGKIIGQQLLLAQSYQKYSKVTLNWVNDDIPAAVFNNNGDYPVVLKWSNDRVSQIAIPGYNQFDYTVDYDDKGTIIGFTGNEVIFKDRKTSFIIEYTGEQITKITGFESRIGKKPWIRTLTDYTYDNNKWAGHTISYTQWEPNTPKNIKSDFTTKVTRVDENHFIFEEGYGATVEKGYDSEGRIISNKNIGKTTVTTTTYKYADNKMWSEDELVIKAGEFSEHGLKVHFSLKDQPATAPDYTKRDGWYKFDKNGDCISENRDGKERKKVNGVWSEWAIPNYRL